MIERKKIMSDVTTFYTCPYCNKEHSAPADLARCILSCEEKKRAEEAEARRARLAAERESRYQEVVDAYRQFEELRGKFVDDYGRFTFAVKDKPFDIFDLIF
jgi:transcription elongation factor Elf1